MLSPQRKKLAQTHHTTHRSWTSSHTLHRGRHTVHEHCRQFGKWSKVSHVRQHVTLKYSTLTTRTSRGANLTTALVPTFRPLCLKCLVIVWRSPCNTSCSSKVWQNKLARRNIRASRVMKFEAQRIHIRIKTPLKYDMKRRNNTRCT